jgi:hypothetical protein
MATPPTPEELQKQFEKLQKLATALGKDLNKFNLKPIAEDTMLIGELIEKWNTELNDSLSSVNDLASGFKSVVQEISKGNVGINATKKTFNSLTSIAQQLAYEQSGINKLSEKELQTYLKKSLQAKQDAKTSNDILEQRKKALIAENKSNDTLLEQKKKNRAEIEKITGALIDNKSIIDEESAQYKDLLINLNRRINQEKEINKLMGLGGAAVEGTQKALNKMGFGGLSSALGLDEVKKKMRETSEEIEKSDGNANSFANKFKVLRGGIKEAGQQLMTSLRDPLVVVGFLVDQMVDALQKADTQTGQLAKAFGTSYSEALSLRSELNTIASLSGDINMTTGALQESLIAVNKEFGTATMFSGELLTDFTNMTKVMGYTDEAALKLSKITVATGTDLSDNTAQILGTAAAFNVTNKLALNEKEIVEGVAKASAATTVSLGMQPGKIASAVVQAKALGLELEQVEGIAESLLNFESSISNELEAELLTGRSLNLEQARYLALTNDVEGVAKEIAKQGITSAEFGKMNAIQQKSLAEAVGMTKEELAQSLINQQALTKAGMAGKTTQEAYNALKEQGLTDDEIAKKLGDEKLAQQMKSQSIQERFTASVEKLKEIFVTLTEPLLIGLNAAMNVITPIIAGFEKMKGSIKSMINPELAGFLKQVLGGVSSAAAIGTLMVVLAKLTKSFVGFVTRGTKDNPMITKPEGGTSGAGGESGDSESTSSSGGGFKPASIGKQLKTLVKNPKAIGRALRRQGGGSIMKGLLKGGAKRIPYLGALLGAGMEFADGGFNMESAGRALLSGGGSFLGGLAGTAIAPGAGTIAGGIGGGIVGDALGDALFGKRKEGVEEAGDFISRPGQPLLKFREDDIIMGGTNLLGNSAQTTSPSISPNMAPLVNEMQAVKAVLVQILNKDSSVYMDGAKVGKGIAMASSKIG